MEVTGLFWAVFVLMTGPSGLRRIKKEKKTERQRDRETERETERQRLESKRPCVNGDVRNSRLAKGSRDLRSVGKETLTRPWGTGARS